MLEAIEQVVLAERPDAMLVYGDTNSTLAGALAAAKCGVPVVHVEAGLRSFNRSMPEEINRVMVDHLSTLLCCPSAVAVEHLAREGVRDGVENVGDVMHDALRAMHERLVRDGTLDESPAASADVLVTLHRPANTDDAAQLARVLEAVARIDAPVVWPMHPRTSEAVRRHALTLPTHVHIVAPLGYRALVAALARAHVVVTDSGGLQKEAYWMGTPCLTVRSETEWTETVASGWNRLVNLHSDDLADLVRTVTRPTAPRDAYGPPGAAARIVHAIEQRLGGASTHSAPSALRRAS
jgi:UDP-N-acetylglucosamine 2-epimerase